MCNRLSIKTECMRLDQTTTFFCCDLEYSMFSVETIILHLEIIPPGDPLAIGPCPAIQVSKWATNMCHPLSWTGNRVSPVVFNSRIQWPNQSRSLIGGGLWINWVVGVVFHISPDIGTIWLGRCHYTGGVTFQLSPIFLGWYSETIINLRGNFPGFYHKNTVLVVGNLAEWYWCHNFKLRLF